jgi:threonine/homoserine/homoserine lactone efflux protein
MLETLLSFAFASFVLALSPGTDNFFVLTKSITNGKKSGLATVFGLIFGCIVHTTLLAFGVSAIIKKSENLFITIKIFGAVYLLHLAFKVFNSTHKIILSTKIIVQKNAIQDFKEGFIMNVLNPKVTIFFLAFFPGFLFSNHLSTTVQFYILGGIFMIISLIVFSVIVFLATKISKSLQKSKKIETHLKWMQIIVFITIAVFIFLEG